MPADRATLADLARRLEGGETGPEMDWDLAAALMGCFEKHGKLTTSLDAAVALVERMLPREEGWWWSVYPGAMPKGSPRWIGNVFLDEDRASFAEDAPTPAAALALALVRALMARGDAG